MGQKNSISGTCEGLGNAGIRLYMTGNICKVWNSVKESVRESKEKNIEMRKKKSKEIWMNNSCCELISYSSDLYPQISSHTLAPHGIFN